MEVEEGRLVYKKLLGLLYSRFLLMRTAREKPFALQILFTQCHLIQKSKKIFCSSNHSNFT
ncbi:unnamed protein product, partial [Larinioides sclopetarius]